MQAMKEIANYDLETKVVGLLTDDTNTNFGSLRGRCKTNVLNNIKSQLNRNIIDFGCNARIIHNCAETFYFIPVDIKILVTKIFGYFHMCTVRVERPKDTRDFAEK
jgi:hypothetical protein